MQRILRIADKANSAYSRLPERFRLSALPFILASLPIAIASMLGAYVAMPLVVLVSVAQLYSIAKITDPFMFAMKKQQARLLVTIPLTTFISLWAIGLFMLSRREMLHGIVGPYCLSLLLACAPAYRWNHLRVVRRIRTEISFAVTGLLALAASITYFTA